MTTHRKTSAVIISVPHARCVLSSDTVLCDSKAKELGTELLANLSQYPEIDLYGAIYESVRNRDMELRSYRNVEPFRIELTKKITLFKQQYPEIIHFDIHSFNPNEHPIWSDSGIIIPETRHLNDNLESVGLSYYLQGKGIKIKIVQISTNTANIDIHDEMNERNIRNVVIEVNENLTSGQIKYIANTITEWVISPRKTLVVSGLGRGIGLGLGLGLLGGVALGSIAGSAASSSRPYPYFVY